MTPREAIRTLKERIKALSAEQKADKAKRKTCPVERQPQLWSTVFCRSAKITACLNFYLALRGREYRHKVPADSYYDRKYTTELAKEFAIESKV